MTSVVTDRRQFLVSTGTALLAAVLAEPLSVWADVSATADAGHFNAFNARSPESVYTALGLQAPEESSLILIDAPDVAENGANVPVEVTIQLQKVQRALVVAERNLFPLLADVQFSPRSEPWFEVKVKLAETSKIRVIVESEGKLFSASRSVKVIVGGCLAG